MPKPSDTITTRARSGALLKLRRAKRIRAIGSIFYSVATGRSRRGFECSLAARAGSVAHVHDLEMEAFGREQRGGIGNQVRPGLVRRAGHARVQKEKKLAGETIDRRRLSKSQAQAHGLFQPDSVSGDGFIHK